MDSCMDFFLLLLAISIWDVRYKWKRTFLRVTKQSAQLHSVFHSKFSKSLLKFKGVRCIRSVKIFKNDSCFWQYQCCAVNISTIQKLLRRLKANSEIVFVTTIVCLSATFISPQELSLVFSWKDTDCFRDIACFKDSEIKSSKDQSFSTFLQEPDCWQVNESPNHVHWAKDQNSNNIIKMLQICNSILRYFQIVYLVVLYTRINCLVLSRRD